MMESTGMHYDPKLQKCRYIFCPFEDGEDCAFYFNGVCYIANPTKDCDGFAALYPTWKDWEDD